MKYIELTRFAASKITLFLSVGYFLVQRLSTWLTLYFEHNALYEKHIQLKRLCITQDAYNIIDECNNPQLASIWPVFSSFGAMMKESFFCGNVSCIQLFFESWTGLIVTTTVIISVSYIYIKQMNGRKYKKQRMTRLDSDDILDAQILDDGRLVRYQ